ncbi:hypothetical protein AB5I41_14870 [Sphingomonas sp. MMS24-JH45]
MANPGGLAQGCVRYGEHARLSHAAIRYARGDRTRDRLPRRRDVAYCSGMELPSTAG